MKRFVELPEQWDEIPDKLAHYFFKQLYYKVLTGKWDTQQLLIMFSDTLLGRKKYFRSTKQEYYADLINQCCDHLSWMFQRMENDVLEINYNTIHNLFPKIGKRIGPDISEITFAEYRHSVAIFEKYNESEGDDQFLTLFAGIMYRDKSEEFDRKKMDQYEKIGKKIPPYLRYYIYIWFMSFNQMLLTETFTIDGNDVCFAPIFGKEEEGESTTQNIGLNSILFTLADTGTFGNVDQTDNAPLFKVLLKLLYDKNTVDNLK